MGALFSLTPLLRHADRHFDFIAVHVLAEATYYHTEFYFLRFSLEIFPSMYCNLSRYLSIIWAEIVPT